MADTESNPIVLTWHLWESFGASTWHQALRPHSVKGREYILPNKPKRQTVQFLFLYRLGVILMVVLYRMTLGISWWKWEPYQLRAQSYTCQVASRSLYSPCFLFHLSKICSEVNKMTCLSFSWLITCWRIKCSQWWGMQGLGRSPVRTWKGRRKGTDTSVFSMHKYMILSDQMAYKGNYGILP